MRHIVDPHVKLSLNPTKPIQDKVLMFETITDDSRNAFERK
jgi:hypothetical protein